MFKLHIAMIAAIILMAITSYHQTCGAALVADIQGVPYHVKRSFCNTYGGCSSSKRALQQQPQQTTSTFGAAGSVERDSASSESTKKDSSAGLVAEILGDLIEYLQNDEKYRQGKYVVMVPKQIDSSRNLLSATQRETNSPGEMQELQVSRLYVK